MQASTNAAEMSLYGKYTGLKDGIDEARRQSSQCLSESESIHEKIQHLYAQRQSMEVLIQKSRQEAAELSSQIQHVVLDQKQLEERLVKASMERDEAKRNLGYAKRFVEEERRDFLAKCRDFRVSCKRIRLAAQEETVRAFLDLHNVPGDEDSVQSDDEFSTDGNDTEEDRNPSSTPGKKDIELEEAMERSRRSEETRQQAHSILEKTRSRRDVAVERSVERAKQVSMQRSQLERIQTTMSGMEKELTSLLRETRRAQEMGENFAKDAARRKERSSQAPPTSTANHAVTPSPYSQPRSLQQQNESASHGSSTMVRTTSSVYNRNPYAKPTNPYSHGTHRGGNSQTDAGSNGRNVESSSLNRQHPHLVGRIRVDRQFTTALQIMSTEEEDVHGVSSNRTNREAESAAIVPSSPPTSRTLPQSTQLYDLDDSDEEENELLSFVAFPKK